MNILRLLLVVVSFLVIAACSPDLRVPRSYPGDAATVTPGVETVSFHRLRFALTTSAQGARFMAQDTQCFLTGRLMGATGDPLKQGSSLQGAWVGQTAAGDSVGVTMDYAVIADQPLQTVPYIFEQLGTGASVLRVYHIAKAGPALLAEIAHPGGDPYLFSLDLAPLNACPPMTGCIPARPRKMLWAYYYPWYYENDWDVSILQDGPALGYYGSDSRAVIEQHIAQAQGAGIDGFISSWWGPGSYTDENLRTLLDVAQERDFRVMINFELLGDAGQPRSESEILAWLRYAMSEYGDHPAYMRVDGRPVFVIWASSTVSNDAWENILAQLQAVGWEPFLLGQFSGEWIRLNDLDVFDGQYQYNILNVVSGNDRVDVLGRVYEAAGRAVRYYPLLMDAPAPKIWAATVQPGYDDHLIPGRTTPILDRETGALYRATWEAALQSDPDWIFITSWNEWWEHTYIEPSGLYGDQYLQITGECAGRWKHSQVYLPLIFREAEEQRSTEHAPRFTFHASHPEVSHENLDPMHPHRHSHPIQCTCIRPSYLTCILHRASCILDRSPRLCLP